MKKHDYPAIPPNDYKGTVADWIVKLQERGWWDGVRPESHVDVMLTKMQYHALLTECEK